MGRKFDKKRQHWKQQQRRHRDVDVERADWLSYLTGYKYTVEECCHGIIHRDTGKWQESTIPTEIGGCAVPRITEALVREQTYLALPTTLTSKHRRLLHEVCLEVGLYHTARGHRQQETRQALVSLYVDGFGDDMTKSDSDTGTALYQYRPWACRLAHVGIDEGRHRDVAVEHLVDHPEDCLRDGVDDMDYSVWRDQNLSDMSSPSISSHAWLLVDSEEAFEQCMWELEQGRPSEIAFDIEAYNPSKYTQLTCLFQLSSNLGKDYVIDVLAPGVWDEMRRLSIFFADPDIVKVGHSIGGLDIQCLARDFGISVVNAFDTYEAVQVLGHADHGLASVCAYYGLSSGERYAALQEAYQACDWRQRPLTPDMMEYGRSDVHYMLRLRKLLIRDLVKDDLWEPTAHEGGVAAAALRSMLQALEDAEDASVDGNEIQIAANVNDEDDDDDADTFATATAGNTGVHVAPGDGNDAFFTPTNGTTSASLDGSRSDSTEALKMSPQDNIASAATLRLQPRLMTVISRSQDRSRETSCFKFVQAMNRDQVLRSFVKYADASRLPVPEASTQLYESLVHWRQQAARQLECLPDFVAPLDFMGAVALLRPTCVDGLRRISYILPPLLERSEEHRESLLDAVRLFIIMTSCRDGMQDKIYRVKDRRPASVRRWVRVSDEGTFWLSVLGGAVVVFTVAVMVHRKRR